MFCLSVCLTNVLTAYYMLHLKNIDLEPANTYATKQPQYALCFFYGLIFSSFNFQDKYRKSRLYIVNFLT